MLNQIIIIWIHKIIVSNSAFNHVFFRILFKKLINYVLSIDSWKIKHYDLIYLLFQLSLPNDFLSYYHRRRSEKYHSVYAGSLN